MQIEHDGKKPEIHRTARVAPNAVLCGDVRVGANTSIGFGAVLTAETGSVTVGANCVIMENAVLRGTKRFPLRVGDSVLVGPTAYLTGCTIEDEAFIATNVSVFNGAKVGRAARVRIGAVVHLLAELEPGVRVPIGWVSVGAPAVSHPPDAEEAIIAELDRLDFFKTVFGVNGLPGMNPMPDAMKRYTKVLARHDNDQIIAA